MATVQYTPQGDLARRRQVLSKAAIRAADRLGLTTAQLARVIGVSPAAVSRLRAERYALDPATKSGELAACAGD